MKILNKLAIKNLTLNKKRTISTVIGIILSCSLICAVAAMVTSFQATLVEHAIHETGYYHLKLSNVTEEDVNSLKSNHDIGKVKTITENGYAKLEKGQNQYKPYLKLYSMGKEVFESLNFNLVEGEFPKNEKEVVISKHIIDNAKVNYQAGDKIKIEVGQRKTKDGEKLYDSNPYREEEEELVNTSENEFTIVGIIERPNYSFEPYSAPAYTVITTNQNHGKKEVYLTLKNPKKYDTVIPQILGAPDYETVLENAISFNYEDFSVNRELLRWEVFAFGDSTVQMLYTVAGVVLLIILFTSVFCIRNSFAIATTEKMKMYGMLASVGATKKQIKKNIIFEALLLGIVGIPVGIVSGIFAVIVLIKIVNSMIGEYLFTGMDGIVIEISIFPILLSVVLGVMTIYLSAISSARKASKVSLIHLLRNSDEIKIKAKKLKVPACIAKTFKTGGELAYKNLKRSKKKYRTTVISISVSIFIFIAMNTFLANTFDLTGNYYEDYDYNVKVYCRGNMLEEVEKIQKLDNVDAYYRLYDSDQYLKISDETKINKIPGEELQEDGYYDENGEYILSGEGKVANLQVLGLDKETFQKYVKKIGVKFEKVKKTGILCDEYLTVDPNSGKQQKVRRYQYSVGDTIQGKWQDEQRDFKIGAITDVRPYGMEKSYYSEGYLVVNLEEYPDIEFKPAYLMIQSSDADGLVQKLEKTQMDIGYTNLESETKREKSMVLIIKIFLYGFITVITLIGVTNIFNTITSNMELRQKEFAMLKSIGMTKKEFNRMINLETIFYSTKSLLYGITMGLLGTMAMNKAFSVKMEGEMYLPIKPIVLSVIAVFILVFVIMKYSIHKINQQNTIETIRNENI